MVRGRLAQEDVPDEFSNILVGFVARNRIGEHGVEVSSFPMHSLRYVSILL